MSNRISIIFMITEKCNCNCFFCSRNNLSKFYHEPTYHDCCKAFDILSGAYPHSKLVLSGGEPTISKNFFPILDYVSNKFEKIEIQTNGTFDRDVADKLIKYLRKNVFIQFSIDGTEDIHDEIRGKGTFKKVVESIGYLQSYHSHLSISSTVTPANMDNILSLSEYLNGLRFRRLTVSYVQPLNPLSEKIISAATWNNFVDQLLIRCFYRVDVSKLYAFDLMDKILESGKTWHGIVNCGRGVSHFYVSPTFDILPCTCTDQSIGNLLADDILDIKNRLMEKERIHIHSDSICNNCKYLPICNGGCPGLSLKVFHTDNMGDIRCPRVYEFASSNGYITQENIL